MPQVIFNVKDEKATEALDNFIEAEQNNELDGEGNPKYGVSVDNDLIT